MKSDTIWTVMHITAFLTVAITAITFSTKYYHTLDKYNIRTQQLENALDAYERLNSMDGLDAFRNGTEPRKYDGMAYGSNYFCVWTKGNTYARVMEVCNHEWMHTSGQMTDVKQ